MKMQYIKNNHVITPRKGRITTSNGIILNPTEEQLLDNGYESYEPPKVDIVVETISKIEAHDKSEAVNTFFVNSTPMWIDRDARNSLFYSTTIEKQSGATTSTLYYGGVAYVAPIDALLNMLAAVELYAKECYRVTQDHIAAINSMTIEEIKDYDITSGYPERLMFNL